MTMDITKVAFTSNRRYEYIATKGHMSLTANGVTHAQTITYNLGYIPFYRLFLQYPGRTFYEPLVQSPIDQGGYFDYEVKTGVIDGNHMTLYYLNNTANPDPTIAVYYRIYAEPQV